MRLALAMLLSSVMPIIGQVVTNWVAMPAHFRVVGGQLYNTELSQKWQKFDMRYSRGILTNLHLFVQVRTETKKTFVRKGSKIERTIETPETVVIGEALVRNFPKSEIPHDKSAELYLMLMKTGETNFNGKATPLFDYGLDYVVPVVSTNKPKYPSRRR
jgi:hypothetical protein